MNNYSICKEAALFERSLADTLVLLDVGIDTTYLSLLSKGKLLSTEVIFDGLGAMMNNIMNKYHFSKEVALHLLKYSTDYDEIHKDDTVFIYSENDKQISLSFGELKECISPSLNTYIDRIMTMCGPIIEKTNCNFIITGDGADMKLMADTLKSASEKDVNTYYPDSIGVREAEYTAIYGSLLVYREKALFNNQNVTCVDMLQYDATVDHRKIDVEGESLTMKIKNLFDQYKNKED